MSYIDKDPVLKKAEKIAAVAILAIVLYGAVSLPIEAVRAKKLEKQTQPYAAKLTARHNQLNAQKDSLTAAHKAHLRDIWDEYDAAIEKIDAGKGTGSAKSLASNRVTDETYARIDAQFADYEHKCDSLDQEYIKACDEYNMAVNKIKQQTR